MASLEITLGDLTHIYFFPDLIHLNLIFPEIALDPGWEQLEPDFTAAKVFSIGMIIKSKENIKITKGCGACVLIFIIFLR